MADQADIHRMARSESAIERQYAAYQFFFDFKELPDKEQAWKDLSKLINDKIINVRRSATEALGVAFPYIPDKLDAWNNLHRLTWDMEYTIRIFAAEAIGVAFLHIPDKKKAFFDLIRLTQDKDSNVRAFSFHSLGKVSIFRAESMENEEAFKKEMDEAIKYFEKASKELTAILNPARFCLPFYCSFYAVTFNKEKAEAEVEKYIAEAKSYVEGSESKKLLLEAVENLGNALKETHKARNFSDVKADLNAYRRYCDRACELLDTTEEKAPGASRLIRRGLPIIDERIKGIIAEIQEKAKALCKKTKGTTFEDLGKNVYRIGQNLLVENPIILEKRLNNLQISLAAICARTSDINIGEACELLKKANDESILENRIQLMDDVISKILPHIGNVTNIQISNSNNIQITTANGTTQKMSIEIEEKTIK